MCVHAIFVPRLASMLLGPAPPGRQRLPVIHNGGLCHFKANDSILIQKKKLTAGFEKKRIDCLKVSLRHAALQSRQRPLAPWPLQGAVVLFDLAEPRFAQLPARCGRWHEACCFHPQPFA